MRIVVDFRNAADGTITLWTKVSFTYIVVSRSLNGDRSDIWATVAEVTDPTLIPHIGNLAAIDTIGAAFQNTRVDGICNIYQDPNHVYAENCDSTQPASNITATGGEELIHSYIMGFKWNPAKTTTSYLSAGVSIDF